MNRQAAFDKALSSILKQEKLCFVDGPQRKARYNANGNKCSVGYLIDNYNPSIEGFSVCQLKRDGILQTLFNESISDADFLFLVDVQLAHDVSDSVDQFASQMKTISLRWKLK